MHTRLRIRTLLINIVLFFGVACLAGVGIGGITTYRNQDNSIFLSVVLIAMFLVFVGILVFTLGRITIDEDARIIKFFYPLRFAKRQYSFDDVIGFRYKFRYDRQYIKVIKIKTADGKIYGLSDWEISNIDWLESSCLNNFELKDGRKWDDVDPKEKEALIQKSIDFSLRSEADKRFQLILFIVMVSGFSVFAIYEMIKSHYLALKPLLILVVFDLLLILKLISKQKQIKQHKANI